MKRAVHRDYFRQIRKTPRRFFAILLIVALGTSFFSGIRAASPDMRLTVDKYFDDYHAADVRLLSTAGFDSADLAALEQAAGEETVLNPLYTADGFVQADDNRLLVRFRSLDIQAAAEGRESALELPILMEGRLPETAGECLVDERLLEFGGCRIGDKLQIDVKEDPDMEETLSRLEYTVVGGVRSTAYISLQRGSSAKGSGSLDGFVLLPEENFTLPVHTEVLLRDRTAAGLSRFTDEYDERIGRLTDRLDETAEQRAPLRLAAMRKEADDALAEAEAELTDGEKELLEAEDQLTDGWAALEDGRRELDRQQDKYDTEIGAAEDQLAKAKGDLEAAEKEITEKSAQLAQGRRQSDEGKAALDAAESQITSGKAALDQLAGQIDALRAALDQLSPESPQYGELSAQLAALEPMYAEQLTQWETGRDLYAENLAAWQSGSDQLEAGEAVLAAGQEELERGRREYAAGLAELTAAKADGAAQLADARQKLADSRRELVQAQAEYDAQSPEAKEKLADARKKLADARKTRDSLEEPQWIALDLDKNEGFAGYAQDTDRIAAIGLVFPLIFFLVAALVSLTNMTRMVEDDRELIGLYKALGYGRWAIAAKYLLYSGLAASAGTVVGLAFGQKLFPWIICDAYGILYRLPPASTPYNLAYSLWAAAGALLCSVLPAFLVCQTELFSSPASLMRPRAPKEGKRILLERIPLLWKHINFSKKVTCRNIFRYKKRLLMTVVGIAGCTALIFTGFGLRDSIQSIVIKQYEEIQKYDMQVSLDEQAGPDDLAAADRILREETGRYMYFLQKSVDVMNDAGMKSATLLSPNDLSRVGDFIDLRTRKGHTPLTLSDDGVVITEKLSSLLKVKVGDTIRLKDADNQVLECRVAGIAENYAMHYVYMSGELYQQLTGQAPVQNAALCQLRDTSSAAEDALSTRLLAEKAVTSTYFNTSLRQNFSDMISSMDIVVVVLILSAGALAFIVLFSLTTINIDERRRELATLKVLGFYNSETAMYIYRENMILTALGIMAGLLLGALLLVFVITTVEVDMVMFSRSVRWFNYLIAAAMTALFALLVNLLMTRVIQKINMVESMKSVE
ncbi:MAG: FtsX-like permease family protein [Clostridiales bacterium]|nr:FtsX-like permease family protein [Clostridiales bacterium]